MKKEKEKEKIREYTFCGEQTRKAIGYDCGIFYFKDDVIKLLAQQNKKCYFCGKPATKRGRITESPKDKLGILVPLCEKCWLKIYEGD